MRHPRNAVKLLLALAALFAPPRAGGQSVAADIRGIYIYTNDLSQVSNATAKQLMQSLSVPGVDGVAIDVPWSAIEPAMGQYTWTLLDQWVGQVATLGKKIDLVIPAGSSTPAWLFQPAPSGAGAKELMFTVSPHSGETGVCDTVNIAAPWDAAFLAQWDAMLAAVAAHLKSAGTYNAITLLRLTGVNRNSEELRLPAETPQSTGLACVTDALTTWQQAGYKPSLLLQGWNGIVASFLKSFPDKTFAVSIIPSNPFPRIDESGKLISGTLPDENLPLMTAAAQKLPGRFVIQNDFLMPGEAPAPAVIQYAQTLNTMAAFQTNEYLGGSGAGCSEPVTNSMPCTASTYLTMLETGIYPLGQSNPLRSQYIETFHDNVTAFPDSALRGHFELVPPAISLVANAEGESPAIAPNTWVEIKGTDLSLSGHTRIWQGSDFTSGSMPTSLDGVSVSVNGKPAFVYYISPTQVNVLTPPDAMSGPVQVMVTNNGTATAAQTVTAQPLSPSFFVFDATHVAAIHQSGAFIGPTTLYPGLTTPAKPGEVVTIFANGFGPTSMAIVSGSPTQSGTLNPLPVISIGGATATVQFAGLVAVGEFQFNVIVPPSAANGDLPITATYNGGATQAGAVLAVQK